eukprot:scaffold14842_cov61-Phaeocystis_antarctica.AAC.2
MEIASPLKMVLPQSTVWHSGEPRASQVCDAESAVGLGCVKETYRSALPCSTVTAMVMASASLSTHAM